MLFTCKIKIFYLNILISFFPFSLNIWIFACPECNEGDIWIYEYLYYPITLPKNFPLLT